jgi:hypothetical protein
MRFGRHIAAILILAGLLFGGGAWPYLTAQRVQDSDHVFSGYLHFPEDMDAYTAFMRQSADGGTLFYNPYDPQKSPPVYWNTLWWLAGKFQPSGGFDLPATIQGLRLIAALLLMGGFWWLAGLTGLNFWARTLACLWFGFGGGLGFLAPALNLSGPPLDLYTELFPFFQATLVPHAGIAHGLMLLLLAASYRATTQPGWHMSVLAAVLMALLGSFRPYDMVTALGVLGLWTLVWALRTRSWHTVAQGGLIALPGLLWALYWRWLSNSAPGFEMWATTNHYPPPAIGLMAAGIGLPLLGLLALPIALKKRNILENGTLWMFATVWTITALALMFSGLAPFAWRTCAGFVTPLVLLTLLGVNALIRSQKLLVGALALLALAALPTSVELIRAKTDEAATQYKYDFQPESVLRAMDWLGRRYPGSLVMTHGHIGLKLPARGLLFSLTGHKDMCADFEQKRTDYHRFINARSPREAERILTDWGVDTVFYGPLDRRFGSFDPAGLTGWAQVFENKAVAIYKRRSSLSGSASP